MRKRNITELRNYLDRMKPLEVVSIFSTKLNRNEFYMKAPEECIVGSIQDLRNGLSRCIVYECLDITKCNNVSLSGSLSKSTIYGPWIFSSDLEDIKNAKAYLKKLLQVTFIYDEIDLP
jgi:hypothetical protein